MDVASGIKHGGAMVSRKIYVVLHDVLHTRKIYVVLHVVLHIKS